MGGILNGRRGSEDNNVAQKQRKCRTGRERALTSDAALGMVGMATTAVVRGTTKPGTFYFLINKVIKVTFITLFTFFTFITFITFFTAGSL